MANVGRTGERVRFRFWEAESACGAAEITNLDA